MRRCVSVGVAVGMILASLTPYNYGFEYPGEAWATVGGVTLDRVAVPPHPEGDAVVASPRVGNMALIALGGWVTVIALGGAIGGGLGLMCGRRRTSTAEATQKTP